MARIELSDMIAGLHHELQIAQKKAESESLKFKIDAIDVEVQVTVSLDAKLEGSAKWKFWVFAEAEAKAGAGIAKETVQTIRLKLTPEKDGTPVMVTGEGDRPK